jgi:hypothetical protein
VESLPHCCALATERCGEVALRAKAFGAGRGEMIRDLSRNGQVSGSTHSASVRPLSSWSPAHASFGPA